MSRLTPIHEIQKPQLSPVFLTSTITTPLRYFFSHYAGDDLAWNAEFSESKIDISSVFDVHKLSTEYKPRIIVSRGGYQVNTTGLTDNLAEAKVMGTTLGLKDSSHFLLIDGVAWIKIQANHEGVCQRIADLVQHFVTWTSPILCNTQGFKKFGFPLQVSDIALSREDRELFEVMIQVPWTKEEAFRMQNDANRISAILTQFKAIEAQTTI